MRPVRPAFCAGSVYPAEPAALRAALDAWLELSPTPSPRPSPPLRGGEGVPATVRGSPSPPPGEGKLPATARGSPSPPALAGGEGRGEGARGGRGSAQTRLLVAPHIDYPRGARGWASAYAALSTDADLFVVFGTAHATPPRLFALTRRDHATPLGIVPTDHAAVDAIAGELGEREVLADERAHDGEHSIELQLVVLRHLLRRPFTVLPVLCSSLSHLAEPARFTGRFLSALERALRGRRVCFVASADLAHFGPAYGDPRPPSPAEAARLEARDRETLAFLAAGDADGFHRDAVRDDERRRLCGIAPIYAAIRASGAGARLLHYERWTDGVDSVSFAAAAG